MEEIISDETTAGRSRFNLYLSVIIVNIGVVGFGFVIGWSSPFIPFLQAPDSIFPISKGEGAWLTSLVPLGTIFGPFIAGKLLDNIGRRKTILYSQLMILTGWILMSMWSIWLLYTGRLLMGIAVGMYFTASPIFIAEISEDSLRGMLNNIRPIFMRTPLLLANAVSTYISYHGYIIISCFPIVIFLILYKKLPETPYFLLLKNKENEAINQLSLLRQLPESSVLNEINMIKSLLSKKEEGSWKELFTKSGNIRALLTVCSLVTFQELSGASVILFSTQTIFQISGINVRSDLSASIIVVMMIIGTFLPSPLIKLWGYKKPLLISAFGSALCMGFLAYFIQLCEGGSTVTFVQWMVVVSLSAYQLFNITGLSTIPLSLPGEYFLPNVRASGSSIFTTIYAIEVFAVIYLFPYIVSQLGLSVTCWFACGALLLATMFVTIFIPETNGLSFAQIQDILNGPMKNIAI